MRATGNACAIFFAHPGTPANHSPMTNSPTPCRQRSQAWLVRVVTALAIAAAPASTADGLPFDPATQKVDADHLRIHLERDQVESLSATGLVDFTAPQLATIRRFYPNAAKRQDAYAATFNDSVEGLDETHVAVIWVAADEVAVTLNPVVLASEPLRAKALATPAEPNQTNLRIGPGGKIFLNGKPSSIAAVHDLMAKLADTSPDQPLTFCVSPPHHLNPAAPAPQATATNDGKTAAQLDAQLTETIQKIQSAAATLEITLSPTW